MCKYIFYYGKRKKKKLTSDHWKFFYKLKNNFQGLEGPLLAYLSFVVLGGGAGGGGGFI